MPTAGPCWPPTARWPLRRPGWGSPAGICRSATTAASASRWRWPSDEGQHPRPPGRISAHITPGGDELAMRLAHRTEAVRSAERGLMATLPDGTLMQRAAAGLAAICAGLLGTVYGSPVVVLAGSGDNG